LALSHSFTTFLLHQHQRISNFVVFPALALDGTEPRMYMMVEDFLVNIISGFDYTSITME
jgi:hypothetical protein